jgi:hypothetical protein
LSISCSKASLTHIKLLLLFSLNSLIEPTRRGIFSRESLLLTFPRRSLIGKCLLEHPQARLAVLIALFYVHGGLSAAGSTHRQRGGVELPAAHVHAAPVIRGALDLLVSVHEVHDPGARILALAAPPDPRVERGAAWTPPVAHGSATFNAALLLLVILPPLVDLLPNLPVPAISALGRLE